MRIIRLTAENIKKIRLVDITPDPHLMVVGGANMQGKSTVLDSFMYAIGGKDAIPAQPIRTGSDKAMIRLDCGEFIVKRTFTRTEDGFNTSILVLNPSGSEPGTPDSKLPKWNSPQEMLDAIMGELSFDPLAFTRMRAKDQLNDLRKIVKLPIDIDKLAADNEEDFRARADINRDLKKKKAQAESFDIPPGTPETPVDESAILDAITSAASVNADIERRRANRERAARDVAHLRESAAGQREAINEISREAERSIAELREDIARIEKKLAEDLVSIPKSAADDDRSADELEARIASAGPLPDLTSVTALRASLSAAKVTNSAVSLRSQKAAVQKEADELEASSRALTQRMEDRDRVKLSAIKSAKMPVDGLGFGPDYVTYNDQPFEQASGREQLLVSVSIAMAANPKLRVIRIKDGGLLDKDGMKLIADLATEKDYQVWVETCHSDGQIGIVMEDGAVKE